MTTSPAPIEPPIKVLLATFGTLGDVYPFIAVALACRARGLVPVVAAPELYRDVVEGEGIGFAPLRPGEDDIIRHLGVDVAGLFQKMLDDPHFILDEIYLRFLAETYEDVMRAGADADIVLTQSLLVGANLAAEKLGRPRARVALAPLHLQSASDPSWTPSAPYVLRPRSVAAKRYNRVVRSTVRLAIGLRLKRLHAYRRAIGLPPTREDLFLDFGRDNTVEAVFGLFSPLLAPLQPDHPKNVIVPGFPFFDPSDGERRALAPDLRAFLCDGAPPVVFTLGSYATDVAGDFYDQSLVAARSLGLRAVLLAGYKGAARIRALAGAGAFVCETAPHALLFPRSLCVVHHGGIGTTAEAMRAGKPQIIVPFFGDQPDQGVRIERLGLGLTVKLSKYDERTSVAALRHLIAGDHARRAEHAAGIVAAEEGVEAVAAWVADQSRATRRSPAGGVSSRASEAVSRSR